MRRPFGALVIITALIVLATYLSIRLIHTRYEDTKLIRKIAEVKAENGRLTADNEVLHDYFRCAEARELLMGAHKRQKQGGSDEPG